MRPENLYGYSRRRSGILKPVKPNVWRAALLSAIVLVSFQNCGQNYDVASVDTPSTGLTPESVESACRRQEVKTYTLNVDLADPGSCAWGADGNGTMRPEGEARLEARREQLVTAALPTGAKICGLNFRMDSQYVSYDDLILFHFNNHVFAASYAPMIANLDVVNGLKIYDWSKMRGQPADPRGHEIYCLGESQGLSRCRIPRSESNGRLELMLDQQVLYRLSAARPAGAPVQLGVVTTGDNDTIDCRHSRLQFSLDFSYVD